MMEKNILSKVIEVEREIQERLREEKSKSLEWVERAKKEAEDELAKEEEGLKEYCRKTVDDTGAAAEKEAAELLRDSALHAEKLAAISDDVLTGIVLKYIQGIVPVDPSVSGGSEKLSGPSP
jgi:vacuolar-type H+-ATPase subunit H